MANDVLESALPWQFSYLSRALAVIGDCSTEEFLDRRLAFLTAAQRKTLKTAASEIARRDDSGALTKWMRQHPKEDVPNRVYWLLGVLDAMDYSFERRDFSSRELASKWQTVDLHGMPWLVRLSLDVWPAARVARAAIAFCESLPKRQLPSAVLSLYGVRARQVVTWIEENVSERPSRDWGRVAATCGVTWQDVRRWLAGDRRRKLLAIHTLNALRDYDSTMLEELAPKLRGHPGAQAIRRSLQAALNAEAEPLLMRKIAKLMSQATEIQ